MAYIGYSMSKRAIIAYREGKVPFSKLSPLTRRVLNIITDGNPQEQASEWHHTSKYYNKTFFYDKIIEEVINKNIEQAKELIRIVKEMFNHYIEKHNIDFKNEISFLRVMNIRGCTIEKELPNEIVTRYKELKKFFRKEIFVNTSNL
jgi:hypothetical protein